MASQMAGYESVAAQVEQVLIRAFSQLRIVARRASEIHEKKAVGGLVSGEQLSELRPDIFQRLEAVPAFYGTGFVADPGTMLDGNLFKEWWFRAPDTEPRRLPASVEYDYTKMEYFARASRGLDTIVGPYLDFTGADLFIFTLAVPVYEKERFLGVSAADVTVGTLERLLLQALEPSPGEVVLITDEQRVVASNSDEYGPGDKLKAVPETLLSIDGAGVGWQLGVLASA